MPEFDLGRTKVETELPRSLADCDHRLEALKEKYQSLQDNRSLYKTQKEYWKTYGKTLQAINAELQILKAWRKAMVRLVDKDLTKEAIAKNIDPTNAEGVIRSLYYLIESRLSHERPIRSDEKPAMLAAMTWLREWRSIHLADRINPEQLIDPASTQENPKAKKHKHR